MRRLWAAGAAIAMCLALAPQPSAAQPLVAPSPPPATTGSLTVTITDLEGASASRLAVVLFRAGYFGGEGELGGFAADVTSDPFTVTDTIREGSPLLEEPPMDERPVALVAPGPATVVVWVAKSLHPYLPYTVWIPVASERFCTVPVYVREGIGSSVSVSVGPGDGGVGCRPLDSSAGPLPSPTSE